MDAATHAPSAPLKLVPSKEVDPHNEVLDFWVEVLGEKAGAIVVRFDCHSDMVDCAPEKEPEQNWSDYAKNSCDIDTFMIPAVHYGIVSLIYWYNPRFSQVARYGTFNPHTSEISPPTTTVNNGKIRWVDAKKGFLNIEDAIREIRNLVEATTLPKIMDTDFDALLATDDGPMILTDEGWMERRYELLHYFLKEIDIEADCITSALSVTPAVCTPVERVPEIREKVRELEKLVIKPSTWPHS